MLPKSIFYLKYELYCISFRPWQYLAVMEQNKSVEMNCRRSNFFQVSESNVTDEFSKHNY